MSKGSRPVCSNLRFLWVAVLFTFALAAGCGALSLGKFKGIEKTSADEKYYLLKSAELTAGSAALPKTTFDHNMNESVNLLFTVKGEKNYYVAESVWFDPLGQEFRTVRRTYDIQQEGKKEATPRAFEGTPRVHTVPVKELFDHKPGVWKVALYIDGELARRLEFSVR